VFEKISEKKKIFFIYFNIIIIFLIKLDILYQFIFGRDFFGFTPGMCGEICLRFSGVFGDELIAGSYLSQIGLLILMLFFNLDLNKSFYNFFIKPFLLIFFLLIILVTGERAALLIVIISFFFIFYFKKEIIKFFFIFLFLLTLIFFSSQKIKSINIRFVKLFDSWNVQSEENTTIKKINNSPWFIHYKAAIELFIEKPIIGHGPKSFRVKCANTNIDKEIRKKNVTDTDNFRTACASHPHNYLLEFLSEHGIVGGIFFIGLFCFLFIIIYKKVKNGKSENIIMLIGTGSLILAIIFPFKPSGSFFSTFNASMLFYIFGFFLYYLKKVK
jgi:O-antigen ligase